MAQHLIDSPYDLHHLAREGLMLSPGWARVGLTFGDERLREQALNELAASIAQRISNPPVEADPNQLRLASLSAVGAARHGYSAGRIAQFRPTKVLSLGSARSPISREIGYRVGQHVSSAKIRPKSSEIQPFPHPRHRPS